MSYDLYITDRRIPDERLGDVCADSRDGADPSGADKGMYFNYTYNLAGLFSDFAVNPTRNLDGLTGRQAADLIGEALDDMGGIGLDRLGEKYDPDNGWGNVTSAAAWLARVEAYCREHPDYVLRERS